MADPDLCGRMLGEFVLRERIDEGGFGDVYRCEQPLLGREAVVKVLHQRLRTNDGALQRFRREARLASRLDHPYAAHVYAFGIEEDGLLWIAMELVQGITLSRWLRDRGPMPLEQFVPFFERVAEVVQAAHDRGIVHRDLKPSNVMVIERAGRLLPKLLDFGVAKLLDEVALPAQLSWDNAPADDDEPAPDPERTVALRKQPRRGRQPLTRASAAIGSPPYMSPEQWDNPMDVGSASDIYALGVVAYEALMGHRPFNADTFDGYSELHRSAPIPPLGDRFSPALDRLFQRALAKSPEDRCRSALELGAALRAEMEARMRAQIRTAARQWDDRGRPHDLLWRGTALSDLERWLDRSGTEALTAVEDEFVDASRQLADTSRRLLDAGRRRTTWIRRGLVALAAATALAGIQYRAYLQTRVKEQVAELSITQAEIEQGRQAVMHGDHAEALVHLASAYRRGERSPGLEFMLARAVQPRLAELARLPATTGRMWSAAFSPDGTRIVTTDDRAAQVWDARTYRQLFTLPHSDIVYQAAYAPDGRKLFTAGGDGIVRVWDAVTGAVIAELGSQHRQYVAIAISPDGHAVVAIDIAGEIAHAWDTATGRLLAELTNDGDGFPAVVFSADGHWLATTGGDDVRIVDTRTWTPALTIAGPRIRCMAFDPTGPRLATGTFGGDASIWEIHSGARARHLREVGESIDVIAFDRAGALVVTAARDGTEQVWRAQSGERVSSINVHHGKILAAEFDSTNTRLLAAGADGAVAVSDVAQGTAIAVLEGPSNIVRAAHFDPRGQRVVGASWDGTARVWNASSPYLRWSAQATADDCSIAASLEPDRRFVAVGCADHPTRVWDTARDQLLAELPAVTVPAGAAGPVLPAVSTAGDLAAIARGSTVEVYALPGGTAAWVVTHGAAVSALAFSAVGRDLVTGDASGTVLLSNGDHPVRALTHAKAGIDAVAITAESRVVTVDAERRLRLFEPSGAITAELELPHRVRALRLSPDGQQLLTIPSYTKAAAPVLVDLHRAKLVAPLDGHVGQVFAARFVEGARILTVGGDGTARLWRAGTGQPIQTFRGGPRFLGDATLNPEATIVVAGGGDGVLRFWEMESGRPLWSLQAHKSHVVGIHFQGEDIVTRGFDGSVARWTLQKLQSELDECIAGKVAPATREVCTMITP